MNGDRARRIHQPNVASRPTPATASATTSTDPAPSRGIAVAAPRTLAAPRVSVSAPVPSSRSRLPRPAGTNRSAPAKASRPSGIAGQKIVRQPNQPANRPPTGGPTACPSPLTAAHSPSARPRPAAPKISAINPITVGRIAAVAAPCTTRNATSTARFGATAAPAALKVSDSTAVQKTRRRPSRSPSQPVIGISTAKVRLNATTTNAPSESGTRRSCITTFSGTLTMLLFNVPMKVPISSGTSAHQAAAETRPSSPPCVAASPAACASAAAVTGSRRSALGSTQGRARGDTPTGASPTPSPLAARRSSTSPGRPGNECGTGTPMAG